MPSLPAYQWSEAGPEGVSLTRNGTADARISTRSAAAPEEPSTKKTGDWEIDNPFSRKASSPACQAKSISGCSETSPSSQTRIAL